VARSAQQRGPGVWVCFFGELGVEHGLILETRDEAWPDEAACQRSASALALRLPSGGSLLLELEGPLGAGKTTFVRYLLRALGLQERVKSPTYSLMECYALAGGLRVVHCDFYRFNDPQEWEDAGFREVFDQPGLTLVEWPEMAQGLLPKPDLRLCFGSPDDPDQTDARRVTWQACSARGLALL
jgi:tRNA threonylcarbamoyladenosine biosynthesis protein TsaE